MSTSAPDDGAREAAALPSGRFSGRSEFQQVFRDALAGAVQEGWSQIIISDADFEDWPLGERAVAEMLHDWCRPGRKFVVLARRYDELVRRHARFVTWRRTWAHLIECWSCTSADPQELPSGLWSPSWHMRRLDLEHSTGMCGADPKRRLQMHESLQEWLRKSSPSFPATTLGL